MNAASVFESPVPSAASDAQEMLSGTLNENRHWVVGPDRCLLVFTMHARLFLYITPLDASQSSLQGRHCYLHFTH